MEISVGCILRYDMPAATGFVLQIEAAKADSQIVKREQLSLPVGPVGATYRVWADPVTFTRKVQTVLGPGPVEIRYEAIVDVDTTGFEPADVREFDFATLPMEYLGYIAPSRYCPSDTFTEFAHAKFGNLPRGHARVTAVCDWIFNNVRYQAGSTGPNSTAVDAFHGHVGVCRDFAHLGISLCRALGIPARYASVYADGLTPQDFHAVFQAYLVGPRGGEWFSFDASQMSSVDSIVRIAAGRDAADVAFAWPQAPVTFVPPQVWVSAPGRSPKVRTPLAVGN